MAKIIPFRPRSAGGTPQAETAHCIGNTVVLRFPGVEKAAPAPAPEENMPPPPLVPTPPARKERSPGKIEDQRKAMLAKIHIATGGRRGKPGLFKLLEGFNEDVYRYTLGVRWGVDSAADLDVRQLHEVLAWLAELGFQSSRPFYARRDYHRWGPDALIAKINALLADRRKPGEKFIGMEYAEGILKRQTKGEVDNIYKATPKQLRAVIAALDKDASRKGRRRP
ncbi:MAG: regulatory protein GemA [Desulfovibrionaceae bacterium]|nr:regulatory protein GemA [Desulfovibrionaceae bacterium]